MAYFVITKLIFDEKSNLSSNKIPSLTLILTSNMVDPILVGPLETTTESIEHILSLLSLDFIWKG